ncbi:MAG: hypothetical protein U5N86_10850 [Planctomycetota bacterium]|nr:hypothetical protein [Planctomycetota bacterium]
MSYEVFITRASYYSQADAPEISKDEWEAYVKSDPEMEMERYAGSKVVQGEAISNPKEHSAVWTEYSLSRQGGDKARFEYSNGSIVVNDPDKEILRKMYTISRSLEANVQGTNGEDYGPEGNIITSHDKFND